MTETLVNESMTLTNEVLQRFKKNLFFETGSYDGRTIQQALDNGVQRVMSVEVSKMYFKKCIERFGGTPNVIQTFADTWTSPDQRVNLWLGDSYILVPIMLNSVQEETLFWLDAHDQEGNHGQFYVPLMYELKSIQYHPIKTHTIMIDDRRLMGNPQAPSWWRTTSEQVIIDMLKAINPAYKIEYCDSKAAAKDIIVAYV